MKKSLVWKKIGGFYDEEVTKIPSGRSFKIGICDNTVILATKKSTKKDWYLVAEYPQKSGTIKHVKNIVAILKNDELIN